MLWQTLEVLQDLPSNPVNDAAALSARYLLTTHDPREPQRRTTFATIARQQVGLASLYRGKKWFEVAATRLAVADTFDRDVGSKERALVEAGRPKTAEKPVAAAAAAPALAPLLQRANAESVFGEWREVDDRLECQALPDTVVAWATKATHADHEVVVEFRPADPTKPHNATLSVGFGLDPATNLNDGYRLQCSYEPKHGQYGLRLFAGTGHKEELGYSWVPALPTSDGFRRLSIQVSGRRLRAQLDLSKPLEAEAAADVRGRVAVMNGMLQTSTCAIQFRNLRIDPLPADLPSDGELRANRAAANQNAITKAVDEAKELIGKKQAEPASLRLREALGLVEDMAPGVLRDNLAKTIEQMLQQTDPFAVRRKKAAQVIAAELVKLGDEYGKAGMVRLAEVLVDRACDFDPDGQAQRRAAAREAVTKWNADQAAARANELVPPDDDGTVLREWFAKGRKLDSRGQAFVVEGAVARADVFAHSFEAWLPPPTAKPVAKASVFVHLDKEGEQAGLCFDVVDATSLGVVFLDRLKDSMQLQAFRMVGGKWVQLLRREVPMDAWRRDGWHRITVESTETGLLARCGAAEIKLARTMLGKPTGVFALFAGNGSSEPVSLELRAFQIAQ